MARAIDRESLLRELTCDFTGTPFHGNRKVTIGEVRRIIESMPALTPPNEGAKDKNVPTNEPLTLEELKAEAKRQGYKLIKAKRPRFEPCLCGHNVHQWVSGPKGWAVYCKHCGLQGPWAKKSHNAVIVAWNAMILEKRKEQSHEDV